MNEYTNYTHSSISKRFLRATAFFCLLIVVGASFFVFGNTYSDYENELCLYEYGYMDYSPDYLQNEDRQEDDCYYGDYYQEFDDYYDSQSDVEYYHIHDYPNELSEHYDDFFDFDSFTGDGYIDITPFATWGGPYPVTNFQLQFRTQGSDWPGPNTPLLFSVPPSDTGVSLANRGPFLGHGGIPARAGFTMQGWGGQRNATNVGTSNMTPSAVLGNFNGGPGHTVTTEWRALNAPNAAYYPVHFALGSHPTASGHAMINFLPAQLGMPDISLNNDNHLALAASPSPPVQLTRAVVNDYIIADFTTYGRPHALQPFFIAPLQFKLQTNDVFEFVPSGSITGTANHVTTEWFIPSLPPNPVQAAYANINIIPVSGLVVGTHTDIVRTYQRGHEYRHNNGVVYWVWHDAWSFEGSTAVLAGHKYNFEIRFVVERPAIAAIIPIPEGPGREATVYVDFEYGSNTRSPDPIPYDYDSSVPGFVSTPIYHPSNYYRDIQVVIPPPRYTFYDFDENDPNRRPIVYREPGSVLPITPLPITPPDGFGIVDARVDDDGNLVVRLRPLHTLTFHLNGGHIITAQTDPVIRTNRLQGCLIQEGDGNAITGHAVTNYPFFNTHAMPQRGVPVPNPTRQNSVFQGWREVNAAGAVIDPTVRTPAQVAALRVTGNRYFEAVYSLRLTFYKTDLEIYNNPFDPDEDRNTLAGAVFQLRELDDTVIYTTTATGTNGRVQIGAGVVPPGLILPSGPPDTVQFKLVETTPPEGFRVVGYWLITVNVTTGEIVSITSQSSSPAFIWRPLPVSGLGLDLGQSYTPYEESEGGYIGYAPYYEGGYIGQAPTGFASAEPPCDCHQYAAVQREYYGFAPYGGGYIPITPASEVEFAVITHPDQLTAELIDSIPTDGVPHIIRLNFPANMVTTTASDPVAQIVVPSGNRYIILDSYNGSNQVWHRNQPTGRHFALLSGVVFELRNVTLTRSEAWVANNPSVESGGIGTGAGTLRLTHPNATISNNRASVGGAVSVAPTGTFFMSAGNIINNISTSHQHNAGGGGIYADGIGAPTFITLEGGRVSGNRAVGGFGGGIGMCCGIILNISGSARIYNNHADLDGGGINMGGWTPGNTLIMNGGHVSFNHANQSGGGISAGTNQSTVTIHSGTIDGNTANQKGGGIFIPYALMGSPLFPEHMGTVTMNGGSVTRNWAAQDGGGLYVSHNNNGAIFVVNIAAPAVFRQNVAGNGMRVNHVMNTLNPQIAATTRTVAPTGHLFTNHDINSNGPEYGWHVGNHEIEPDWIRLNHAINILSPAPATIIIHEAGAPGMLFDADWHDIPNSIFHLVIRDPNANAAYAGRTITTLPILLPSPAPGANPHRISVTRNVAIRAAEGANIILRMPVAGFTNVANAPPWNVGVTPNLGRHFIVSANAGSLTLGSVTGTGTLTLDGNRTIGATEHAGNRGGIIVEDAGTLTMRPGSTIMNGRATNGGGVLVNGTGSTFTMTGGTVGHATNNAQANIAQRGGGVWIGDGARFYMQDYTPSGGGAAVPGTGVIVRNEATGAGVFHVGEPQSSAFNSGGGVYLAEGGTTTFTLSRGDILLNRGTGGGGVAISDGTFNMSGGLISENRGDCGGGVRVRGGIFNMTGGTISDHTIRNTSNLPSQEGGGVQVDLGTFNMHGGTISGNHSNHGGGVHVRFHTSAFNMHGGTIVNNEDVQTGGGGVRVVVGATFTMHGGDIRGNTAPVGGGVVVSGRSSLDNGNLQSVFTMTGGTIGGTIAAHANSATVNGGGVWVGNGAVFNMNQGGGGANPVTSGTISRNTATGANGRGGGVYVTGTASIFTFNQGTIGGDPENDLGNRAYLAGGGVHVANHAQVIMNNGNIRGNSTTSTTTPNSRGGGVQVTHGATFTMHNGIIEENSAWSGGGIDMGFAAGYASNASATLTVNGGSIRRNTASFGGGVMVGTVPSTSVSTFNMTGGYIYENTAAIAAGVGSSNSYHPGSFNTTTMTGGHIRGNRAIGSPTLDLSGLVVSSPGFGGGVIMAEGSIFNLNGGTIGGNLPAHRNIAHYGGGVVATHGGVFNMQSGHISGNEATTTNLGSTITGSGFGGGVWLGDFLDIDEPGGTFNMYGGTIGGAAAANANTAVHGGGLYLDDGILNLRSGTNKYITRNTATFGGGVFVGQNATMVSNAGSSGVRITHNAVTQRGGGIYSAVAEYGDPLTRLSGPNMAYHNLTLTGIYFNNNTAGHRESPPSNALAVMTTAAWISLSTSIHPFNNYDINFIGEFGLPLTGGLGSTGWPIMLSIVGAMFLVVATVTIVAVKKRRVAVVGDGFVKDGQVHRFTKVR